MSGKEQRPVHIVIEGASKAFLSDSGRLPVLENLSLTIHRGELLTFFGPNGCGKTTLLNVIAGIESLDRGDVRVEAETAQGRPRVGFIFQDYRGNLMPWLTVAENIAFPLKISGVPRAARMERVEALLDRFDLRLDLSARTYTLSGGQAQITSILRALIIEPEILLMDEPFSALDYQTNLALYEKLLLIWRTTAVTILLISHDIDEALYLGERTVFLTRRPARIAAILENTVPGRKSLEQLGTQDFAALKRRALEVFQQEVSSPG